MREAKAGTDLGGEKHGGPGVGLENDRKIKGFGIK